MKHIMEKPGGKPGVGGWEAPCVPFDYGEFRRAAERELEAIRGRLDALKRERVRDAEREFLRRREICILTDMYYEQKHNIEMFRCKEESC